MKNKLVILAFALLFLLAACSGQHSIARRFVKQNRNTVVALYLPERLDKRNLRNDSIPEYLADSSLKTKIAYLEKQVKVIDKVDDDKLLDIIYLSMKETLKDYGLSVEYWEDSVARPDSTHWVIDIPRIEVTEVCEKQQFYARDSYYNLYSRDIPVNLVNVATWFSISNDTTATMTFTEQNYLDDIDYVVESQADKVYSKTYCDTISIDGFYRFAKILGKLYAGYCYDFLMNKYIDNHKVEPIDKINRYRYDPYERYFYKTDRDYLIEMK